MHKKRRRKSANIPIESPVKMEGEKDKDTNEYVWKNNLLTVNGSEEDGKETVYLVGLIQSWRKPWHRGGSISGKILIMDCNAPFYKNKNGNNHARNLLSIDSITLTSCQRDKLEQDCKDADGMAHFYIGEFCMGACQVARDCTFVPDYDEKTLLELICESPSCEFGYVTDMENSITMTRKQLTHVVNLRQEERFAGPRESYDYILPYKSRLAWGPKLGINEEQIRFWIIKDHCLLVDLVCFEKHYDYSLDVKLTETFICEHMEHGFKEARTIVKEQISVDSTITRDDKRKDKRNEKQNRKQVSVPVILLEIPNYHTKDDIRALKQCNVLDISYVCQVHLTEYYGGPLYKFARWKLFETITSKNVWTEQVLPRGNIFLQRSARARIADALPSASNSILTKPSSRLLMQLQEAAGSDACSGKKDFHTSQCRFPVSLTVRKLDLRDEAERSNKNERDDELYSDDE